MLRSQRACSSIRLAFCAGNDEFIASRKLYNECMEATNIAVRITFVLSTYLCYLLCGGGLAEEALSPGCSSGGGVPLEAQ